MIKDWYMTLDRAKQLNEWFLYKKINGTLKIEEVPTWILE
jgi:hypothetical protein